LPNQDHRQAKVAGGSERAIDLSMRRVVAAHRVENDFSR
jgi:hypothetical protein